jgi:hypothetical protein
MLTKSLVHTVYGHGKAQLTQDMVRWYVLVNAAISLRVQQ